MCSEYILCNVHNLVILLQITSKGIYCCKYLKSTPKDTSTQSMFDHNS